MKRFFLTMAAVLMMSSPAISMKIGHVTLPDSLEAGDTKLVLNGGGWRKKVFIKVYAGGLYLKNKSRAPQKIIDGDEPMAIRLHMVSGMITSEKMIKATREGFEKSTGGNMGPLKEKIETFLAFFKEKIKENDIFDLIYMPPKGVHVNKNGAHNGTITGLEFKRTLFGIWLGDKPADKGLKKGMLGQ